jgi:hypothetical protein
MTGIAVISFFLPKVFTGYVMDDYVAYSKDWYTIQINQVQLEEQNQI